MRQIAWGTFQLLFSLWFYSLFIDDPSIDLKKEGGLVAFASFMVAGIATMILSWIFDLLARFYAWAQQEPKIEDTLVFRFRARLNRPRTLLRINQGADKVSLTRAAARTGSNLPKQIGTPGVGHDPREIV